MTAECLHSRGAMRPSCACILRPEKEGVGATPRGARGMPGARCTRSRVRSGRKHTR